MTAPTVVEIFETYVAGYGLRAIAQALIDDAAISTPDHRCVNLWMSSLASAVVTDAAMVTASSAACCSRGSS